MNNSHTNSHTNFHTKPASAPFRVLLYYKYVPIWDYESFADEHLEFCKQLGVLGRIVIAEEGINGTVSGTIEQTEAYMRELRTDSRFEDMWFKIDEIHEHAFDKIFVRAKKEIVTWRFEEDIDPTNTTGAYLTPEEFYAAMQQDDVIIIDGRNDYEYDLGHFQGAIRPQVKNSREFPDWIRENLGEFKDKKVLTYCTGGIRCEKLSGFLIKEGFTDVAQLHGGIVTYAKDPTVRGQGFEGDCYVFDKRISVPVNQVNPSVVSKCLYCGIATARYRNCGHKGCHTQFFLCESCEEEHTRSCSPECKKAPKHRHDWYLERGLAQEEDVAA